MMEAQSVGGVFGVHGALCHRKQRESKLGKRVECIVRELKWFVSAEEEEGRLQAEFRCRVI